MATNENSWDFECPQFVDFTEGLNHSDCKDQTSLKFDDVFPNLQTPDVKSKNKLTKAAENKLINKMNAALSVIQNTPSLAFMKKKHMSEKANKRSLCQQITENAGNKTILAPTARMHRSKSVAVVDKITVDKLLQNKMIRFRKSSSLDDLKTIKKQTLKERGFVKKSPSLNDLKMPKKHTYPMTPMCLKRTIIKSKAKVKSTEELELEEIAKLQKQLIAHLRYNEISLKKLKLKPRAYMNPKVTQFKEENLKEVKGGEKALKPFLENLNLEQQKEKRRNLHKLNHDALKHEALKINSVFNNPKKNKVVDKQGKENIEVKPNTSSSSVPNNCSVLDQKEKEKAQVSKKSVFKKIGFHSGLLFHDNVKKNTLVKPFSFDGKITDQTSTSEQKVDTSLSSSVLNLKVDDIKENIPQNRTRPTFNSKKSLLKLKTGNIQQLSSNRKVFEKRVTNQMRGLPLSENIARN